MRKSNLKNVNIWIFNSFKMLNNIVSKKFSFIFNFIQ